MTMEKLNEVRKAIKPLGFGVKTKSTSFGKAATYYHIESGKELSFNVFTPETLATWKPLLDWRKANAQGLKVVRENENCVGLV
jgi:hypothetical protein